MSLIDKDAVISILKRDAADGDCMTLIADSTAREIEALPTIEAEPRWIPVTERLPEKYGWYLCTLKDGRVNTYYWDNKSWVDNVRKYMFEIYDIKGKFTGKTISPEEEFINWDDWVIAWMPLPEPAREVEE